MVSFPFVSLQRAAAKKGYRYSAVTAEAVELFGAFRGEQKNPEGPPKTVRLFARDFQLPARGKKVDKLKRTEAGWKCGMSGNEC